eukprot:10170422-Alexandrium_andersonii.AAC.1
MLTCLHAPRTCTPTRAVSCRILSRPWAADLYLKETIDRAVLGATSPCQHIEHSAWFKTAFVASVQEIDNNPTKSARIKNVSTAKQRYDSSQVGLSKATLYLHAFLNVQVAAATRNSQKTRKDAIEFLEWIDAERCCQLSMMADAGDELNVFLRSFDNQQSDPARIPVECGTFVGHIDYLFVQGNCRTHGYTKYMLELLRTPVVLKFSGKCKVYADPKP